MKILEIKSSKQNQIINITSLVQNNIKINSGLITIYCPHTTAALTINESADPDVKSDILLSLNDIVKELNFKHTEGNSSSHVKSSMIGKSVNLIVENSKLQLGTWDAIYFCEFDGPRNRKIWLKEIN